MPKLHLERKYDYINNLDLSNYDAGVLVKNKNVADYFEECVLIGIDAKAATNWITSSIMGYLNNEEIDIKDFYITPKRLKDLIDAINSGTISSKQAKEIFNNVLLNKQEVKDFLNSDNAQISDSEELTTLIDNILANNPNQIAAYKNGKTNLFDFFVGQVMKETKGKANPVMTKEILNAKLNS